MSILRVKADVKAVVYDEETDTHVPLTPGQEYDSGDSLVKQHPWAFQRDADVERGIEQGTRRPGERRG